MLGRLPAGNVEFRPRAIDIYTGKKSGSVVISFDGAQPTAPKGADLEQSQTNYLIGNNPALWRTHVSNYSKVTYSGLYRGVDAVFYGNGNHLEHDFIVQPGADYRQIRMHFPDNSRVQIEKDGALAIYAAGASLRMEAPSIYQNVNGKRQQRHGAFHMQADGDVGFTVASYDPHFDLIIDPILDFSTYLSPLGSEAIAIASDANGNSYVTGDGTIGYPVTSGAFAGCATCTTNVVFTFISKLSADGSKLLYSTVLGGNNSGQSTGIAVDASGDAIVSGWTSASDFPTKSGQPILPQNNNSVGFLVSLSPDGSSLNYGTLLGSSPAATQSRDTYATAMTIDGMGNTYVTGYTGDGFFISSGALNQAAHGETPYNNYDVFLAKFSPTGTLIYSAVLGTADPQSGGAGATGASAIAVNAAGDAYLTGGAGTLWPITSGAYRSQIAGSESSSPFVMEVAPDAKSVIYSTYLDAAGGMTGIAVLANGDAFVVGNDAGADYPTTANAYEPKNGSSESFLTELNASGSALVYSTMLCAAYCSVNGMAIDPNGNIWLASETNNARFPLVLPMQSIFPYSPSGISVPVSVLSEFDPTGQTLKFATFLGGSASGYASSVAIDPNLRVHVSGTAEYGMYTTPGVYAGSVPTPAPAFSSSGYAYIALIDPTASAAGLCASPNTGLFFDTLFGTSSEDKLTITNCGAQPLSISDVTTPSSDFSVPASEDGCLESLSVGQSCTLSVRFAPTGTAFETSTLTIASNSPIPAVLALGGQVIAAPVMTLSASSLTFGPQLVGTESTAQTITLTNTGSATLNGIGFGMLAADESIFPLTYTCGPSLAPGDSCTFSVAFKPTSTGTTTATLSVENSSGVPFQQVTLSGTSPQSAFTIGTQDGGSMTSTVTAGGTAAYAMTISSAGGYSGNVNLSCNNLPANASCTFTPASITVTGGTAANFTLSVSTASNQLTSRLRTGGLGVAFAGLLFLIPFGRNRRRAAALICFVALVLTAGISACSGGGGSSATTGTSGTTSPQAAKVSPGTYTIQVAASDPSGNQITQSITLIVQ